MKTGALALLLTSLASAYPFDGFPRTRIGRLLGYRLAYEGKIPRTVNLPPGALFGQDQVRLRLQGVADSFDLNALTPRDPYLQQGIQGLFAGRDPSYNLAMLDISDPAKPRYAALREDVRRIPGSVGKLLVATGMFGAVKRAFPDPAAREKFLRETVVAASNFVHTDSKTVPFFKEGDPAIRNRRLEIGDAFNLYEWLDHMLSQSSNAAAAETWRQLMLLYRLGPKYTPNQADATAFFANTPKKELAALSLESIESAMTESGINTGNLRIGTFFTRNGERAVPGTASYATPLELLRWLVKLEQGKLVDPWSSLELKRLLYFSRPRYRYSSSPALSKAAVYFKSGSLFECVPEEGYQCVQYKGNKTNLMHSVAIVESGTRVYLVALMSNVLRLNSAVEHQTIATMIERLVQARPAGS